MHAETTALIDCVDDYGNTVGHLKIGSRGPGETLFLITDEEMHEYREERIQIMEERAYDYELCIEHARLQSIPGVTSHSALQTAGLDRGVISPHGYVGKLKLTVEDERGIPIARCGIEVRTRKIDHRTQFRYMLDQISVQLQTIALQVKTPVTTSVTSDPLVDDQTIARKVWFLRSLVNEGEFDSAMTRILAYPYSSTNLDYVEVPIVRGFSPSAGALHIIASAKNRVPVPPGHPIVAQLTSMPRNIGRETAIETLDTTENRFVKYVLGTFSSYASGLSLSLHLKRQQDDWDSWLLQELSRVQTKLDQWLSHEFFREVSTAISLPLGSSVLQQRDGYREILAMWIRFESSISLCWGDAENIYHVGLRNVPKLYEYWVLFQLLGVVANATNDPSPTVSPFTGLSSTGMEISIPGAELLAGTTEVDHVRLRYSFTYNQTFSSGQPGGSWTAVMRPDYTLTISPAHIELSEALDLGTVSRIHFDAKYKWQNVSLLRRMRAINPNNEDVRYAREDLYRMHGYRNAIAFSDGAFVLFPGNRTVLWEEPSTSRPTVGFIGIRPGHESAGMERVNDLVTQALTMASQKWRH